MESVFSLLFAVLNVLHSYSCHSFCGKNSLLHYKFFIKFVRCNHSFALLPCLFLPVVLFTSWVQWEYRSDKQIRHLASRQLQWTVYSL
jgi:hypothetical protein